MCGICGFWTWREDVAYDAQAVVRAMSAQLRHRGPDGAGHHVDSDRGLAFGHRRLSIVDLSVRGRQPMESADGRFVITYNGEVYNFGAIRKDLGGTFRGDSDTEIVLEAVSRWGLRRAIERFVGMFAFAIFDREREELSLVRDRLGIKPLYWGNVANDVVFASELRPFARFPGFPRVVNHDAVAALLRYNCIPGTQCVWRGVHKLSPGQIATFRRGDPEPALETYWDPQEVRREHAGAFRGSVQDAADTLEELLLTSVRDRMIADVPIGAFLSGGIDSSTVVALMQRASNTPVRTFSIGFGDEAYNEATHAAEVARHLGTDHTELYVSPDDALAVIPELGTMYDEPFADSSQIPTFLVSKLAREHVTVTLSGDGGDELFAGYNRHLWGPRIAKTLRIPGFARRAAASAILGVSGRSWEHLFGVLGPTPGVRLPTEKLQKLACVLQVDSPEELYVGLRTHWPDPAAVVRGGQDVPTLADVDGDIAERMMYWDLCNYLPDDILTKVDRASMAVGLEARVPILDHRVVEFSWSLPYELKVRDGQTKWVLRQVLNRYVPQRMFERPKMGFGVPIDRWLRGPLRDWAESLLDARKLKEGGIFRTAPIRQKWEEHLAGTRDWHHHIWDVLMYQAWAESA